MKQVTKDQLLSIANERLDAHPHKLEGMRFDDVEQKGNTLLFGGECFFNANGGASEKTPQAIKTYGEIAEDLATQYSMQG
ncbi:DUF2498 family protein [Pseudomonas sp. 9Ag]|uniref:DUF2498 family protein n=1 Tax=Pseudomonas sp. 9Ag TaxID=2653167 RepID=UPI0012F0636C|nr:DUF2498 family protein [Pseudomonas sp. 9Ag]VXD04301.1 conserved hypothetical protein [Pseudomonas sp. 9Ag]